MSENYIAWLDHSDDNRYYRQALWLAGPALRNLVIEVALEIADAAHGTGEAAEAWDTYTTARLNSEAVQEFGPDDYELADLEADEAIALTELVDRLSQTIRLPLADARLVADLLFENAGRVGTVTP